MRSLWYKAHYAVRAAFQQVTHVITAHDGGAVTAEFAVVFPTVVAVAVLVLSMTRIAMMLLDKLHTVLFCLNKLVPLQAQHSEKLFALPNVAQA